VCLDFQSHFRIIVWAELPLTARRGVDNHAAGYYQPFFKCCAVQTELVLGIIGPHRQYWLAGETEVPAPTKIITNASEKTYRANRILITVLFPFVLVPCLSRPHQQRRGFHRDPSEVPGQTAIRPRRLTSHSTCEYVT
jgi:hypothetical protein